MPKLPSLAAPLLVLALVLAQGVSGQSRPAPPEDLRGTYDAATDSVNLTWTAPDAGEFAYRVYRDTTLLGKTTATSYKDLNVPSDRAYFYFVTASQDGKHWSDPGVVAVPTLACEVVSASTNWDPPFVYAHVHQECLGGVVYDKDVKWTAE